MQSYGSLASEDSSKVDDALLDRYTQIKKQFHSLQWVVLEEDLVISPTCEEGVDGTFPRKTNGEMAWNGPGIPFHGFSAQPQCRRAMLKT